MPQHPAARRIPILDLAANLGLPLRGRAASCYNRSAHKKGTDNNPSLTFFPNTNSYHCFACGVHGDAITLVMKVKGFSFKEAVSFLEAMESSSPQSTVSSQASPQVTLPSPRSKEVYQRLYDLSNSLTVTSPGGQYLSGRKISVETAQRCHVREMVDPSAIWQQLEKQFTVNELQDAGLMSRNGNFLFHNHQLLFFYMRDGVPQYVMARDISNRQPGEINGLNSKHSPKELALAAVKTPVPYMVDYLNDSPKEVMLCEGHIDTLSAIQLGNIAIGVAGVTSFRQEWISLFHKVNRVIIAFDNDEAGRSSAAELQAQFRMQRIKATAMIPAQGKDINDLLNSLS